MNDRTAVRTQTRAARPARSSMPSAATTPTHGRDEGHSTTRYALLGVALAIGALVAVQYPEIQRYLKMRSM